VKFVGHEVAFNQDFSPTVFGFPLQIIVQPLMNPDLPPLAAMYDSALIMKYVIAIGSVRPLTSLVTEKGR
jgi:hypothetical protein